MKTTNVKELPVEDAAVFQALFAGNGSDAARIVQARARGGKLGKPVLVEVKRRKVVVKP